MPRYWIVVKPSNAELYRALQTAFRGKAGFEVITDRRSTGRRDWTSEERRKARVWDADEMAIAEEGES
jgi:hypothetical protein